MRFRLMFAAALLLVLAAPDGARAGSVAAAQYETGIMLLEGRGVPQDVPAALAWLRKSAEGGDPRGQVALGRCYARGLGVRADPVRAYMWHTIAVKSGTAEAAEPQAMQAAKMTPAQVRQGKRLAREWIRRHPSAAAPGQ